ncbi:MAG: acyl carrier protein [Acidobacteriota bacterium]
MGRERSDRKADVNTIGAWLKEHIAEATGVASGDVDPNTPFTDLGLTSLEAVGISGDMEDRLHQRLPPTLLYDFSTISQLSAHLATLAR